MTVKHGLKTKMAGGLLCGALVLSSCMGAKAAPEKTIDQYFENGVIYTVDDNDTVAEALAVKDGKIVFVGSSEEGKSYRDEAEEVVDLKGQMLLPGFTDAHIHMITEDFFDFVFDATMSLEDMEKMIADSIKANPDQEAYYGFGFMMEKFEGEEAEIGPKKERLDEICADKPIVILSFDGHMAWLNTKAFEAAGITKDTEQVQGGDIYKGEDGELWGVLIENAMRLAPIKEFSSEDMKKIIQEYNSTLNSFGYTGILALEGNGFLEIPWEELSELDEDDLLTVRTRGASFISNWDTEEDLEVLSELAKKYQSPLLSATTAKFFVDGVMDYRTALLLEEYSDVPGHYGVAVWEQEALNEAVNAVHELGLQVHFHAIGDGASRMALDAVEAARELANLSDPRNVITHLQLVQKEDIERFAALDTIAVAQPFWHYKEPGYFDEVEYKAIGERAESEYPMQSFLDAGAILAYSSDYPASPYPNPFYALEISVTRNMPAGWPYEMDDITDIDDPAYLLNADERVSIADAIRGFTASAAYSIFTDDTSGSLQVGKSADMIIIDQNLLEIDPLEISETNVVATYLEGRQVYELS